MENSDAFGRLKATVGSAGTLAEAKDRIKYLVENDAGVADYIREAYGDVRSIDNLLSGAKTLGSLQQALSSGQTLGDAIKNTSIQPGLGMSFTKSLPYLGLGMTALDMAKNGVNAGNLASLWGAGAAMAGAGPLALVPGAFVAASSLLDKKTDPFISFADKGYYSDAKGVKSPGGEYFINLGDSDAKIKYDPKTNQFFRLSTENMTPTEAHEKGYMSDDEWKAYQQQEEVGMGTSLPYNSTRQKWTPTNFTMHNGQPWMEIDKGKFVPLGEVAGKFDQAEQSKIDFGSQDYLDKNLELQQLKQSYMDDMGSMPAMPDTSNWYESVMSDIPATQPQAPQAPGLGQSQQRQSLTDYISSRQGITGGNAMGSDTVTRLPASREPDYQAIWDEFMTNLPASHDLLVDQESWLRDQGNQFLDTMQGPAQQYQGSLQAIQQALENPQRFSFGVSGRPDTNFSFVPNNFMNLQSKRADAAANLYNAQEHLPAIKWKLAQDLPLNTGELSYLKNIQDTALKNEALRYGGTSVQNADRREPSLTEKIGGYADIIGSGVGLIGSGMKLYDRAKDFFNLGNDFSGLETIGSGYNDFDALNSGGSWEFY